MNSPSSKILLVDDHQDTLDLFAIVLTQAGYEVKTASTVGKALEMTKATAFDLLVFDSRLRDGSGIDLCMKIRKRDHLTPILFCSGLAYEENKREALKAGAQAYLVKPVSISLLCGTVTNLLAASPRTTATLTRSAGARESGELAAPAVGA